MFYGISAIDFWNWDFYSIRLHMSETPREVTVSNIFLVEPRLVAIDVVLSPTFPRISNARVSETYTELDFAAPGNCLKIKSTSMLRNDRVLYASLPEEKATSSRSAHVNESKSAMDLTIHENIDTKKIQYYGDMIPIATISSASHWLKGLRLIRF